jgi:hypothetical protein
MILNRTKSQVKPVTPTKTTRVLFDGGRRMRPARPFGAGILGTRYAGQHGFMPFTAEDDDWARGLSKVTAGELDAAEDRYDEILEQRYLESAMLDRYTRGHLSL